MKKKFKRIFSLYLLLAILASNLFSSFIVEATEGEFEETEINEEKVYCEAEITDDFEDGTVIVVLKKEASEINQEMDVDDFEANLIAEVRDLTELTDEPELLGVDESNFHQILELDLEITGKDQVLELIKELEEDDRVLYAGPNYYEILHETAQEGESTYIETELPEAKPNDPRYSEQYAHKLVSSESAWNITTGSSEIKVGIIDTGIVDTHPDLKANVSMGWDFANNNNITNETTSRHGTMVAGIVGAVGNNGIGIAGVAWNVQLIPLQVVNNEGVIYTTTAVQAINYATNNQIDIVNYSLGSPSDNQARYYAIMNYPGVFVASAGNDGNNTDIVGHYPSGHDLNNLISVAYSGEDDELSSGSNYGLKTVDLAAPGVDLLTTDEKGGYDENGGSSFAAPMVAGAAALIKSVYSNLTAHQIKNCIMQVDKKTSMNGKLVSGGRLNIKKALDYAENFENTYFTTNPGTVVLLGDEYVYRTPNLSDSTKTDIIIKKDTPIKVQGLAYSNTGLPRLIVEGGYITANKNYVSMYYTYNPGAVVMVTTNNLYSSPNFTEATKTGKTRAKGVTVDVKGVVYSSTGWPRLQVDGGYITANANYVSKYYVEAPSTVTMRSGVNVYSSVDLASGSRTEYSYAAGTSADILGIEYSRDGFPRFIVENGYISTNTNWVSTYYMETPKAVTFLKDEWVYKSTEFTVSNQTNKYNVIGDTIDIQGIEYSNAGYPRFKVEGGYVTANSKYVSTYYRTNPGQIISVTETKVYSSVNLTSESWTGITNQIGTVTDIIDIEYSKNGYPRFVVEGGYMTTNSNYIQKY